MPKRSTGGGKGRFALLHALAHIELNAIDLACNSTYSIVKVRTIDLSFGAKICHILEVLD